MRRHSGVAAEKMACSCLGGMEDFKRMILELNPERCIVFLGKELVGQGGLVYSGGCCSSFLGQAH